jgi:hypothetical protein
MRTLNIVMDGVFESATDTSVSLRRFLLNSVGVKDSRYARQHKALDVKLFNTVHLLSRGNCVTLYVIICCTIPAVNGDAE